MYKRHVGLPARMCEYFWCAAFTLRSPFFTETFHTISYYIGELNIKYKKKLRIKSEV